MHIGNIRQTAVIEGIQPLKGLKSSDQVVFQPRNTEFKFSSFLHNIFALGFGDVQVHQEP